MNCLTRLAIATSYQFGQIFEINASDGFPSGLKSLQISVPIRSSNQLRDCITALSKLHKLAHLDLSNIVSCSPSVLAALANVIAHSDSLIGVQLAFGSHINFDGFLERVSKSTIIFLSIEIADESSEQPQFVISLKAVTRFLLSSSCINRLSLYSIKCVGLQDANEKNTMQDIVNAHPSLDDLDLYENTFNRAASVESEELVSALSFLVHITRPLAGGMRTRATILPAEVIRIILKYPVVECGLLSLPRLNLIVNSLLDRRTLGLIDTEIFHFRVSVLYVRCMRALQSVA